jgi:hypothetical protein
MKAEKVRVVLLCSALVVSFASSAPAAQKTPKATTHSTKGTIASITADTLVINQTVRGKAQQLTVTLNSETQRSGDLTAGHLINIQYREENQQKVATAVRESGAKAATKPVRVSTKPISDKS